MTFENFLRNFNIKLNNQQLAAVQSVDKPTLLLAVPGSGKTTVLVTRLGYMIYCCNIPPEQILTVTYTVAATNDMRNRFASIFGKELADRLEFRTINGICSKIINYYGRCIGLKAFDLVTDEGHKSRLLSAIHVRLTQKRPTESDLKAISTNITYIKNMMLTDKDIEIMGESKDYPLCEIYNQYCVEMRKRSLMDYDDQMVYALTMLKREPAVLQYFSDMYRYICVDEAQDTSKIQHEIISTLADKYQNLFMVGDEDQSIYGFRAAYPEALLLFEKNYNNANVLLMEQNFRSNANIVNAADNFIQKNELRHKKKMNAFRTAGSDIKKIELKSRKAQYTYLEKVAQNCEVETAVLYRDNESVIPVVDLFERRGIPYRIKNADLTFFSHRIVIDIENIIEFAGNQEDTEIFMQIYYKIGTFINKDAAKKACEISREKGISVLDAAIGYCEIPAGTRKSIKSMKTHMQGLLEENASKAVYRITHFMGYNDYLNKYNIKDGKINIIEAIAANESSAVNLVERLHKLSEIIRNKEYNPECKFILSTIHSSKGLEYERVFIMDAKDGIFPEKVITNRKEAEDEELKLYEEERRLFYVGVTRAKNDLCIFTFDNKSTFSKELFDPNFNASLSYKNAKTVSIDKNESYDDLNRPVSYQKQKKKKKHKITEAQYMDKLDEIRQTRRVTHARYGQGRVVAINGDVIEIQFDSRTTKCMLKYMLENDLIE